MRLGHFGAADSARVAGLCFSRPDAQLSGQGALVLADPKALENLLSALPEGRNCRWSSLHRATVIASQAVITAHIH